MAPGRRVSDEEYRYLLQLRTDLRRFLRWSEEQAVTVGLTPSQHQLLLAIRGHGDPRGPTIGDVAGSLLLRHHSVVGLVDRAESARLLRRHRDRQDHRAVRLSLTAKGESILERLSERHVQELGRLAARLEPLVAGLDRTDVGL